MRCQFFSLWDTDKILFSHKVETPSARKLIMPGFHSANPVELSREHVSSMFFKAEVEAEIREVPSQVPCIMFTRDADFDMYMQHVEEGRVTALYHHNSSIECQSKGKIC